MMPVDADAVPGEDHESVASPNVLIVEDNAHFASTLRNNLEIEGFVVAVASTVAQGQEQIQATPPSLVILDIMLPGRDGYELLRALRSAGSNVPIVVLTARRDEQDKLRGFGLGADDFITKPVNLLELLARIRALLRRAYPSFVRPAPHWIRFGDIEICPPARTVKRSGTVVDLRPKEFELLLALLRQHDRVVSRAELLRDVWGYHASAVSRTIDTHMAGLRHKLEADPVNPRHLLTVRTAGYLLRQRAEG
jgi:DNA-binding response OmpR family regulator